MRKLFKNLYKQLPFKKNLFFLLRRFSLPEYIFRHLYFKGIFSVKVEDRSFRLIHHGHQLENEIFWKGLEGWERISISLWMTLSKKSNVIIDIGANTGLFALVSKTLRPDARVVAFEPIERVYEKLVANTEINNYDIYAVQKGISNFTGTAVVYDTDSDHIYSVTINENLNSPDKEVTPTDVAVITLDHFLKEANIDQVDLIKIDVETHEAEVLEGAIKILQKCQPAIIIEILNERVATRVNDILKGQSYMYFELDEGSGVRMQARVIFNKPGNYLLCTPRDAEFLNLLQ